MSIGLSFLRKICEDRGPLSFMGTLGLNEGYFVGGERQVLRFIEDHIVRYNRIPSLEVVEREAHVDFPDIPDEPLQFWVDRIKDRKTAITIQKAIGSISQDLQDGDYSQAAERVRQLGTEMLHADSVVQQSTLQELFRSVLEAHDRRQLSRHVVNVPSGFSYLDEVSDGFQPGDTVALVGPSGVGKSYVLARMANACHAIGGTPLVVSMEMASLQMARRCLALRTQVNETYIKTGFLSSNVGRRAIVQDIANLDNEPPFYMIDGKFILTIEDLYLYVRSLNPSAVYLDGPYLMKTRSKGGRYDVIAEVAEQTKILAGSLNVPVVGTYQFNDEGEIYGSRAIKFLASIILYLKRQPSGSMQARWGGHLAREISIKKGRFGERGKFRISYNMLHPSIEQLNIIDDHRIRRAEDTEDE